ncbi:MAG: helix-turn-helix transcriptional regulator [Defluviitaleaceae bacterium]|nr:helix-turn-helix transcriptional regulator [Defluviitaleaceae bacterium]
MKMKNTKENLINEYFAISGFHEIIKVDKLIKKLESYSVENDFDREIEYLLIVIKAGKESYKSSDFELCKNIAMPMFEGLNNIDNLSFFEVVFFARVIEFAPTFEQLKDCESKISALLETKYKHEKSYEVVKWMISTNMLSRLVRAKYPDVNSIKTEGDRKEIEKLFSHHLSLTKTICNKMGLLAYLAMAEVREGVFYTDAELIDKSISWLKKNERKTWYPSAIDELLTYYRHLGDEITKSQLDILVGYRIKKKRESENIHIDDAAEYLGLTDKGLEQIESGRIGAKNIHLYKLSYLFNVEMNYFYHGDSDK